MSTKHTANDDWFDIQGKTCIVTFSLSMRKDINLIHRNIHV